MPRPQNAGGSASRRNMILSVRKMAIRMTRSPLTLDEYEVIRLVDLEKRTHEQCSEQMDISRTTVTEIYESARYKLAQCIVNGKRLIITGGNYRICEGREYSHCQQCRCRKAVAAPILPVSNPQHKKEKVL